MCVSYCSRKGALYWNHDHCHTQDCEYAAGPHRSCRDCRHLQADRCGLTNARLPEQGGCCHWNIDPAQGRQVVQREMLAPLGLRFDEPEEFILLNLEIPYERSRQGELLIDPDRLALPAIFGVGTEHTPPEPLDWSGWFDQWCDEE